MRRKIVLALAIGLVSLVIPNFAKSGLIINEFMYDWPGGDKGNEWIEIYNPAEFSVIISRGRKGWRIFDGKFHIFKGQGEIVLPAKQYLLIVQNKEQFLTNYPNLPSGILIIEASFSLKNKEGVIALYDQEKNLVDQINYSQKLGAKGNKKTLERTKNNLWQESLIDFGTPGKENSINQKEIFPQTVKETSKENLIVKNELSLTTQTLSLSSTSSDQASFFPKIADNLKNKATSSEVYLVISEFMPNPKGNDKTKEWIELYNPSDHPIDLKEIKIINSNGKKLSLEGIIQPGSYKVIFSSSNFYIKNKGEILKLIYKDQVIFEVSYYGKAPEGVSLAKIKNYWAWTNLPTPGKENILKPLTESKNLNKNKKPSFSFGLEQEKIQKYRWESENLLAQAKPKSKFQFTFPKTLIFGIFLGLLAGGLIFFLTK